MTDKMPDTPPTEQIYGIAKRMSLDLEKLPLHTHAAVVVIIKTMMEHRKIVLEAEIQESQQEAQRAAMADAVNAHAKRIAEAQAKEAASMLAQANAKPPRSSIELVSGKVEDVGQRDATLPPGPDNPVMEREEVSVS